MIASRQPYNENECVKLGTHNFETAKGNTYLGTNLTNEIELRLEFKEKRIKNANREYYALVPLLKNQSVLRTELIKTCKTLTRPEATCGITMLTNDWLLLKEKF